MLDAKRKAKKQAIGSRSLADKTRYNLLTSTCKKEIVAYNNDKWDNFVNSLNKNSLNSKPFWNKINKIKNNKDPSNREIPTIIDNGIEFKSDEGKANFFSLRYSKIFCDSNDVRFNSIFRDNIEEYVDNFILTPDPEYRFFFGLGDLEKAIKSVNNKSSSGPDKITNKMLKNVSPEFKLLILELFNETIRQNSLPSIWKESVITMIPKKMKGSPNPKDYRPISVTSCLAKLCERLVLNKLNSFMDKYKLIVKQQSGFRKHRQTRDNIFILIQKITESFNRKKKVFGGFFDIEAAFDRVWHNGLIFKMIKLKIPAQIILWIKNFLNERFFSVRINNFCFRKESNHSRRASGWRSESYIILYIY